MNALSAAPDQFLTEPAMRRGLDLLIVGMRHYRHGIDDELARAGLGQAHHRALYFIGQRADITPKGLCQLLGITKQSLGRVMTDLRRGGFVEDQKSAVDGRCKHLRLSSRGMILEQLLYDGAKRRMAAAYGEAGTDAVHGFWAVLTALMEENDAAAYADLADARARA